MTLLRSFTSQILSLTDVIFDSGFALKFGNLESESLNTESFVAVQRNTSRQIKKALFVNRNVTSDSYHLQFLLVVWTKRADASGAGETARR